MARSTHLDRVWIPPPTSIGRALYAAEKSGEVVWSLLLALGGFFLVVGLLIGMLMGVFIYSRRDWAARRRPSPRFTSLDLLLFVLGVSIIISFVGYY